MKKSNGNESIDELKAFLGEDTEFKGVLSFSGTVRIDGKFEGEIISDDTLIVGESAIISADIAVGILIARGSIKGNISATKKIDIRAESKVIGNVKTSVLIIEEGALFDGHCEMVTKKKDPVLNSKTKKDAVDIQSYDHVIEKEPSIAL